ncbi:uncharacterized protein SPAPADRAFT_66191 [Spathaspora passalidarum NRRL Y-27907]|uniref:Uncharacterized protein n=1 Tax=Spathaspora passalidarum (strain NRRL Y-27907 / 11-Y1) TaxID=619300 RepID=G3ALF4_SPAPN|nr:uncharacterized protein SPAPADRAFT_66191 [Spathaspora passalidarum NRRL Y-27907]EGW33197.1 hypothetical protein SPAPADRAFT_66191 [Spathaspora passalidarum NRRL Y-27907]
MFTKSVNDRALYERLTGIQEFSGLPASSLGLTSGQVLNALDTSREEYSTLDLFGVHVSRVLLTILLFVYMRMFGIRSYLSNAWMFLKVFWFDLQLNSLNSRPQDSTNPFVLIANAIVFYWGILLNVPAELLRVSKQVFINTPIGLDNCKRYIPKANTPSSVTLILDLTPHVLLPPPEIPQPYLDADRNIQVPDKKEVQFVIAVRNEYFTQYKSHIAAERVRLLRDISRFITWCCLVPSINELTIYEKQGIVWDAEDYNGIEAMKNSILVELESFASSCKKHELQEFKACIPSITLVDWFNKTRFSVNEPDDIVGNDQHIEIEDVLSSYEEQRQLVVNLCDLRIRETNFKKLTSKILQESLESSDNVFNEELPSTPDLIVAPCNSGRVNNSLLGYACIDQSIDDKTKSMVIFSDLEFGFPFFSKSLYNYALDQPIESPKGTQVPSNTVLRMAQSRNIAHYVKKVKNLEFQPSVDVRSPVSPRQVASPLAVNI